MDCLSVVFVSIATSSVCHTWIVQNGYQTGANPVSTEPVLLILLFSLALKGVLVNCLETNFLFLVNCLETNFLLFFCLGLKFHQLFAMFQILFLLLSCINAVFVTSMPARG
jgi:hypothetical protein